MAKLHEETVDDLQDKIDFNEAFSVVDHFYEARSHLNDNVLEALEKLVKLLDQITEGHEIEDGDTIFDLADDIESEIFAAQESLEKIATLVSSVIDCWPDPDDFIEDDDD